MGLLFLNYTKSATAEEWKVLLDGKYVIGVYSPKATVRVRQKRPYLQSNQILSSLIFRRLNIELISGYKQSDNRNNNEQIRYIRTRV